MDLWYIWKNRNDKIYNNKDGNPQEILRIAEVKGALWAETELTISGRHKEVLPAFDWQSLGHSIICFIDGAWREQDVFTGQG